MTNVNTQYWKRVIAYFDRVEKGEERPTYDELVRRAKRTARHGQAANDRVAELEAELTRIEERRIKAREQFEAMRKNLRKCGVCDRHFLASERSSCCGENLRREGRE